MNNVINLNEEREINELIDKLGSLMSNDQSMAERTKSALNGELAMKSKDDTVMVSVRLPKELLDWIDSYSRIAAVNQESRVTRTMVVVNFLEMAKAAIEYREKHEWGNSHQDEIKKVVDMIDRKDYTGDNEG